MLCIGVFTGPAMILARLLRIFPTIEYKTLITFTILLIVLSAFQYLFSKHFPYSPVTKYISLFGIELLIAFLSVRNNLCIYISYIIVPFLSCLYFNKKFTRNVTIICWIVMVITFYMRSKLVAPKPVDGLTGMVWFAAYGCGSSIEYFVCAIIANFITHIARETLEKQFAQDNKIRAIQTQLITSFANLVESKDPTTGEHVKRTSKYVELISLKLTEIGHYKNELTDEMISYMIKAAPLHDIGKMHIPDAILTKPTKLTEEEYNKIKDHTLIGEKLIETNLSNVEDPVYTEIAEEMALCHHEWWNGQGYPFHLIDDEIPLPARIMAAADVLDALLTVRPYKNAFSLDDTLTIMQNLSGTQFDPAVIEAVLALREDIATILEEK